MQLVENFLIIFLKFNELILISKNILLEEKIRIN